MEAAASVTQDSPTPWMLFDDPASVPRQHGVYVLYDGTGRAIYVGSSGNVRNRTTEHWRKGWDVQSAKVSFMRDGWEAREKRLIRRLRPLRNVYVYPSRRNGPIG